MTLKILEEQKKYLYHNLYQIANYYKSKNYQKN